MATRQQIGDIFFGVTPTPIRQYMVKVFKAAKAGGSYDRIVIPCAGRFTLAEAAIDAGWLPHQVQCSDVTLFSTVLGLICRESGKDGADYALSGLNVAFREELEILTPARARARDLAAAILLGLKLCQLKADNYFERMIRTELWDNRALYLDQLAEAIGRLAEKLSGIGYEAADVTAVCEAAASDSRAILYVNPPGFSRGYSKMFDTRGMITWDDPKIPEFDAKASRAKLYQVVMPAPALGFMFRSKEVEPGFEDRAVFAVERKSGQRDFVLCNRPLEADLLVKRKAETKISPVKLPMLPDGHIITADSKIAYLEASKEQALYYRDLFAHKLAVTRSERYFIATIDGYVMAVFGMFMSDVRTGRSGTVFETFGFCAPSARYPRINHLFMASLVSSDARRFFDSQCFGALREVERFQTTCISTTPEQKSHRSTGLKLESREQMPDGRFKLSYAGPFRTDGMTDTIKRWIDRMANVEKQTGKPMGINLVPAKVRGPQLEKEAA